MNKSAIYKNSINDKLVILFCLAISAMILLRDAAGISYNKFVLLVVCVGGMPLLTYSNFLCLLSFLFGVTFGIPSTYVYLIAVLMLIVKKKERLSLQPLFLFAVFFLMEVILGLFYGSSYDIVSYVGYFCRLFLFFVLISEESKEIDYQKTVKFFSFGVLIFVLAVVAVFLQDNSFEDIFEGYVRIGNADLYLSQDSVSEGMKMSTNTNNLAYFCVAGMGSCLSVYFYEKKFRWVLLFFVIFIFGTLTISKTFFFLSALLIVILLNISFFGGMGFGKRLFVSLTVVGVVLVVLESGAFEALLGRFEEVDFILQDSRSDILADYLKEFFKKTMIILFGSGAFSHRDVLLPGRSIHTGLGQILVSYGILGFVLFVGFCFSVADRTLRESNLKKRTHKLAVLAPLLISVLYTQTIQFLNPCDLMLPYIVGMFALKASVFHKEKQR